MVSFVSQSLNKIKSLIILQRREKWRRFPEGKRTSQRYNFSFTCSTYSFPWGIINTALLSWILKSDATYSALSKNLPVSTPDPRIGLKTYPGIETHPLLLRLNKSFQEKASVFTSPHVKFINVFSLRIYCKCHKKTIQCLPSMVTGMHSCILLKIWLIRLPFSLIVDVK